MDNIQEKISYIEGLAEGLELLENKKEGKFFNEFIGIISEMNQNLQHMSVRLLELEDYVEAIDEDLNDIEWDYYEADEDSDTYQMMKDSESTLDLDEDDGYYEVICPSCHETVMVAQDALHTEGIEEVVCPNCKEILILDTEEFHNEHIHS